MRKMLFSVLFCVGISMSAQTKTQQQFFAQIFKYRADKIVYSEHVVNDLKEFKKMLTKRKTSRRPDYGKWRGNASAPETITLSAAEIDFVISELAQANKNKNWSKGLIKNSRLVSEQEMDSIFLDKDKGYEYFKKNYGPVLDHVSKPVFLKNNTVGIFYKGTSGKPLSGGGGFSIYVKDDGIWKEYAMLTMSVS
ncbi:MAG: hypothetical protein EOO50_01070 [Flavobacterium sp.]|uniref:hypothetical protein n=1 Tax=Flavobacterium sp. TaxID=239 RepID=UPI00121FE839|nr:hypothetical protein [Flavobacterium sp.]RZJ68413.1 MAG: hypothetical protein EOO50_01070 [Flavobacterium sp.]